MTKFSWIAIYGHWIVSVTENVWQNFPELPYMVVGSSISWDTCEKFSWTIKYRIAGFVCEVLICANYARCHGLAHFNSTVTFNSAIVLGVSQLCALLYLMWSKCRYLVSRRPFTEQLRILAIVTKVQHFNRNSAIKFYRHMHPYEGVIIGSRGVFCSTRFGIFWNLGLIPRFLMWF